MNAPNPISLTDPVQDSAATNHAAKDRIGAVEMGLRWMRNEILAATGIGARESHAYHTNLVPHGIDLVAEHEPRPAPSVAAWIAILHHEIGNHAMPARAVEEPPLHERQECRHG